MFNLTKQERLVLIFLASVYLTGICLQIIFKINPRLKDSISLIDSGEVYHQVDINRVSIQELEQIPGIGSLWAQKIVAFRDQTGKIQSLEELKGGTNMDKKRFQTVQKFLKIAREE